MGIWYAILVIVSIVGATFLSPHKSPMLTKHVMPPGDVALAMAQYHSEIMALYVGTAQPAGPLALTSNDTGFSFWGYSSCTDGTNVVTYESTSHGALAGQIAASLSKIEQVGDVYGLVNSSNQLVSPIGITYTIPAGCTVAAGSAVIMGPLT